MFENPLFPSLKEPELPTEAAPRDSWTHVLDAALKAIRPKGGAVIVGHCIDLLRQHVANLPGAELPLAHFKESSA